MPSHHLTLSSDRCAQCNSDFWKNKHGKTQKSGVWFHSTRKGNEPKPIAVFICGEICVIAIANKAFQDDIKAKLSKVAKGNDGAANANELQKLKADYAELAQNAELEPTRRLLKTNETSIQSMTVLQNQNPRGILVFRDELTGLLG